MLTGTIFIYLYASKPAVNQKSLFYNFFFFASSVSAEQHPTAPLSSTGVHSTNTFSVLYRQQQSCWEKAESLCAISRQHLGVSESLTKSKIKSVSMCLCSTKI